MVTVAREGGAFRLAALTCIASFHTDLSGMASAFVVIGAVCRPTVDLAGRGCLAGHIAVGIAFALHKAVTAGFVGALCGIAAHHDLVQGAIEIFVVCTCLYRTF